MKQKQLKNFYSIEMYLVELFHDLHWLKMFHGNETWKELINIAGGRLNKNEKCKNDFNEFYVRVEKKDLL